MDVRFKRLVVIVKWCQLNKFVLHDGYQCLNRPKIGCDEGPPRISDFKQTELATQSASSEAKPESESGEAFEKRFNTNRTIKGNRPRIAKAMKI